MKSAIIFAVIAFALCLSMVGFVRGEGTVVAVDPSSLNITQDQIGNNFTCSINITGVANLWAWSLRLNWNPTVLNATNLQEGPFLKTAGSTIFGLPSSKGPGYFRDISDTLLTASTANGSGILFNVTFEVLAVGHCYDTRILEHAGFCNNLCGCEYGCFDEKTTKTHSTT